MPLDEQIVHVTSPASWLPEGGRAEVVRCGTSVHPMSLVRLLLRRGDQVFCVPRADTGRLDLPTRACMTDDLDGTTAIRSLAGEVVGSDSDLDFLGAVRNVVSSPDANYPWPTPIAHFGVWESLHPPVAEGVWVGATDPGSILRDRHWYPLLN